MVELKTNHIMLKISDFQNRNVNKLIHYFQSNRANVIRRGLQLINDLNLEIKYFEDNGNKNNNFTIRLTDEELKLINGLENKFNISRQEILRYGIEIQYNILDKLKEYEKQLLTEK